MINHKVIVPNHNTNKIQSLTFFTEKMMFDNFLRCHPHEFHLTRMPIPNQITNLQRVVQMF